MNTEFDVIIVGGGIVGLSTGHEIQKRYPHLRILLLEKESTVAVHQTGHNSGVIHSGIYYTPGSLKAKLCVEGATALYEYCREKDIPFEQCGKLIVARNAEEVPRLRELFQRAKLNNVPGVRWLEGSEISEIEPYCVGAAAVHSPSTGIVDYAEVSRRLAADLVANGAEVRFSSEVRRLTQSNGSTRVELVSGETFNSRLAVTCAGLWSDKLAHASGASRDPQILPFRGAYLDLEISEPEKLLRGMVYPVPDPQLPFLGVHITRHIDGRVSLGPTAMIALARDGYGAWDFRISDLWSIATWPGSWRVLSSFWKTALSELRYRFSRKAFIAACAEFMPQLTHYKVKKKSVAGIRAQAVDRQGVMADDFIISESEGIAHVRNAPSPAATSAFAISRYLADKLDAQLSVLKDAPESSDSGAA